MEQLSINLSLAAVAVCLVDAAWLIFALATRRPQLDGSSLLATLLGSLVISAVVATWMASDRFPWLRADHLIAVAATALWLLLRLGVAKRLIARFYTTQGPSALTRALLIAAAVWQFYGSTRSGSDPLEQYVQKGVTAQDVVLLTDQGRVFPVFHFDLQGRAYEDATPFTYVTASGAEQSPAAPRPLQVAPTDPQSNCHGWVFTGGRYGLSENVVDALLQDNGYQHVDAPLPGDVVVYRDASGAVLHTGRVYRVHENGEVWIESKWGPGGRYRHLPQDQGYSSNMQYYRSSRAEHYAQIVRKPSTHDEPGLLASAASTPRRLRRARV